MSILPPAGGDGEALRDAALNLLRVRTTKNFLLHAAAQNHTQKETIAKKDHPVTVQHLLLVRMTDGISRNRSIKNSLPHAVVQDRM